VTYSYTDANTSTATITLNDGAGNTATYNIDDSAYAGDDSTKTVTLDLSAPDSTGGSGLVDGTYDIELTVTDAVGQSNSATGTNLLTIDNTAPAIANPDPADGATGVDSTTRYTVNITDATSGVDPVSITVTVEDSSGTILSGVGTGDSNVTFFSANETLEIEGPTYADGQVNVTVDASDNAGNAASQFTSNFTVGTTQAGQIQLSGTASTQGNSGKYTFTITNTGGIDAEVVAVAINDTSTGATEVSAGNIFSVNTTGLLTDQRIPIDSSTPDGTRVDFNVNPSTTISSGGGTVEFEFDKFQNPGGGGSPNVNMDGATVNVTFFFSDGSKGTLTID
jgi:hypothetical protein